MKTEKTARVFGLRVYGAGVAALGLACLAFGDFDPGQNVPRNFPAHTPLAYCAGAFMVIAASAIEWRRTRVWGAAALTVYYAVFVLLLMNGRMLLSGYGVYGTYEGIAMQLAIAASALIVYAGSAQMDSALAVRLTRIARMAFGVCSVIWGGAHFMYMNMTAPLVPRWLPPGQVFWGYLTGVCFIAAGLAILTGIQARLAAVLLTVMVASFGLLANGPVLVANPSSHFNWTESALNLALTGAAWVVADSLVPG
ncbi:MAG TPA: hypothetical protein VK814_06730 [Acidobacteriaceae bacterium]|nr:hypothetical protein [Acidobacteriaceae bacterium]